MKDIRCPICNALWFRADGKFKVNIRCRKCGHDFTKKFDTGGSVIKGVQTGSVKDAQLMHIRV